MRVFCRLFACLFFCLLASSARATQITIQDPGSFTLTPITTTPFAVTFSDNCDVLLPAGNAAASNMGCFGFVNRTGSDWIGLTLVETSGSPSNGTFVCPTTGVFASTDCGSSTILTFSDGVIPTQGSNLLQYFVISEDDLDPSSITFEAYPVFATTPEPSALVLLATGVMGATCLAWSRRRRDFAA